MSFALAPLLIFGGCCSNVYALESILRHEPDSGLLITLMQFILVTLFAYPTQRSSHPPFFLKKTAVPLRLWAISAAMFFSVNMLNNWAFAFNISVPVHIILRSFGSVTTMAAGWLRGKTYSLLQVVSVVVLTLGVVISAWADALSKGKSMDTKIPSSDSSYGLGLIVLLVAQVLSAFMGVWIQDTYAQYGNHWDENLFYSHLFSLPLFLPLQPLLASQYKRLLDSPPLLLSPNIAALVPLPAQQLLAKLPRSIFNLALNSATQLACITGVNLLGAKSSAVTVTIVLNVRKLVSFMLSVWIFGNTLSGRMVVGAVLVFGAGALYGWETTVGIKTRKKEADMRAANGVNGLAKKGL